LCTTLSQESGSRRGITEELNQQDEIDVSAVKRIRGYGGRTKHVMNSSPQYNTGRHLSAIAAASHTDKLSAER
jgi:hypothetical protein